MLFLITKLPSSACLCDDSLLTSTPTLLNPTTMRFAYIPAGTFTNQHAVITFRSSRITNERYVVNGWCRTWRCFVIFAAVIIFKTVICVVTIMLCNPELTFTCSPISPVKRIVTCTCYQHIFEIDSATKHFNTIILVHVYLDIFNNSTRTDTLECDTV